MAAINITIDPAVLTDGSGTTVFTGKLVGSASLTGLGVGGGPVLPPSGGDGKPPGIWGGPIDPFPGHPLPEPPGKPTVPPPSIWPPGSGIDFPSHPIVIPPPISPGDPPNIPPGTLITWRAFWSEQTGWIILGHPNVPHPAPS